MSTTSLRFSGNLIEELSQKIPSSLFALNELIKNAYDAFSPDVTIKLSQSKQTISICDHGNGMGMEEIDSLFHISKSSKSYGHEVEQDGIKRLTQGSKGLGFLSAFKFGDKVEWVTSKNGTRSKFSVSKSELVAKDDVSGTEISVTTDLYEKSGTTITVFSENGELDELLSDLSDSRVIEKLAAAIVDDTFNIKIEIENQEQIVSTDSLKSFQKEKEDCQLFYVDYDSSKNEVDFYHKGECIRSFDFSLSRLDYLVNVKLVIFNFPNGKNSKTISPLNKRVHDSALYPLVYVNRNLFNNITVFDPELLRKKRTEDTLPQIIGRVSVTSHSEGIDFNSDRTNFVDSSLTRCLIKDLESLNRLIQTEGSRLKRELRKGKVVPTGKAFPNKSSDNKRNGVASIFIDRQRAVRFDIPSDQIDLESFLFQVKDSSGATVENSEVEITVDGEISSSRVLPSIEEPCKKKIIFKYVDNVTGVVSRDIIIDFEQKFSNLSGAVHEKSLFKIKSGSEYVVRMETVSDIINAIDKAYSSRCKEDYLPLIACSIRSIFEISSDKLSKRQSQWFSNFDLNKCENSVKKELRDQLLKDVVGIIILLKKNPKLVTEISRATGISYSTLNNSLDVDDFKVSVKKSHIGAHQSTRFLSKPKVEASADNCGLFAAICDVLINLDRSIVSEISIKKVDESDLNKYLG